jgi:hypothetical protein
MNITHVPGTIRVGEIGYSKKEYTGTKHVLYQTKLQLNYDAQFPQNLKTKHVSMVYIFCVNEEIYKIGQSSGKTGIQGCMNFYLNAGSDDPGPNRFLINWLIREELDQGNKVEVHMIYMEPIAVEVPGLFKSKIMSVPVSAKGIEENCLTQYYILENHYPKWNFQENHELVPTHIQEAYAQYKLNRAQR